MAGSSQPRHFFGCRLHFADFAITLIFYSVIKSFWKFLYILFGCGHTQILDFENMLKIIQKSRKLRVWPVFWKIYNIFAKLIFALKFNIWVCQHPNNRHKNFHKVLLQDEQWQRLQNQQKYILQQKKFCGWEEPAKCACPINISFIMSNSITSLDSW